MKVSVHEDVNCPTCGSFDLTASVRQYADVPGVVDVGWECRECHWEFGFELSPSSLKVHGNTSTTPRE